MKEREHKLILFMFLIPLVVFQYLVVAPGSLFCMFVTGFLFAVILEEVLQLLKFKYRGLDNEIK